MGVAHGALVGVAVFAVVSGLGWSASDLGSAAWSGFGFARWGMISAALGGAAGAFLFPGSVHVIKKTRELFGAHLSLDEVVLSSRYGAWLLAIAFSMLVGFGTGAFGIAATEESRIVAGAFLGFGVGSLLGVAVWLLICSVAWLSRAGF